VSIETIVQWLRISFLGLNHYISFTAIVAWPKRSKSDVAGVSYSALIH